MPSAPFLELPWLAKPHFGQLRRTAQSGRERPARPEIRAAFLRWLATDPEAAPFIDPKGLRVYAATIPGNLDLRECHVSPTLDFRRCDFQSEIILLSAETRGLCFLDSSLARGIRADRVIVHGPLFLRGFDSEGAIRLPGAEIGGNLVVRSAKVAPIVCQNAAVKGDLVWQSIEKTKSLGFLIFGNAEAKGAIAPTETEAYKAFISGKPMPAAYSTLNSFVYTLENAVPLVKLGQDEKWAPDRRYPGTNCFTNYWFLMWSRWLLILWGWVQATVLAAALSG